MKVVIVEDEESAAVKLEKLLKEIDPSIEILAILESIEEAVSWFERHPAPDLVFADIQLADGISFEIFNKTDVSCPVIFITAYDNYAIRAFKLNSIDYLLKPLKKAELENALAKFHKVSGSTQDLSGLSNLIKSMKEGKPAYQKRLIVRYAQTIRLIEIEQTAYYYTEEKVTFVRQRDGKEFSVDHTLDELENMLDPSVFFRVNRQMIVNISAIAKMEAYSKSRVKLFLDPQEPFEIIVSSERSPEFKEWLLGKSSR